MTKQKDYIGKWGYKFLEIIRMPRDQFALMFGDRYLAYSRSKFNRIIQRETPYCESGSGEMYQRFEPDSMVSKDGHRSVQRGVWDELCVFI